MLARHAWNVLAASHVSRNYDTLLQQLNSVCKPFQSTNCGISAVVLPNKPTAAEAGWSRLSAVWYGTSPQFAGNDTGSNIMYEIIKSQTKFN